MLKTPKRLGISKLHVVCTIIRNISYAATSSHIIDDVIKHISKPVLLAMKKTVQVRSIRPFSHLKKHTQTEWTAQHTDCVTA